MSPTGSKAHKSATRQLRAASGSLSTAAVARMEADLTWFRELGAEERSWVGMIVQAGVKGFVDWFADGGVHLVHDVGLEQELDVALDLVDGQLDQLDGLVEVNDAGHGTRSRAEDLDDDLVVARVGSAPVGEPVDEALHAGLHDQPDPRPVVRAELAEPLQVALHP